MRKNNVGKEAGSPPDRAAPLHLALQQLVMESDASYCLDLEEMTDYAQDAFGSQQKARFAAHVRECPLCASSIADLRAAFRPTLALHKGLGGWLGPLLACLRWMRSGASFLWQDHLTRCARCHQRTTRLQTLFSPAPAAALGAALTLLFIYRSPGLFASAPVSEAPPFAVIGEVKGSKGPFPGMQPPHAAQPPWPTALTVLEGMLYPKQDLEDREKIWRKILAAHPDSISAHEALRRLYQERARLATDPRRKAGWREKANAELQMTRRRILSQPKE